MKKILREPLVHFLFIGALLFIVSGVSDRSENDPGKTITITDGTVRMLEGNFTRTWQREPTPEELNGLIEETVREEIAYLEAVSMGLDNGDPYIRRRLRMKMELLVEDLSASVAPSEEDLTTYLELNRLKFREHPQVAFNQVYFNANRNSDTLNEEIAELLNLLESKKESVILENYGDATMLPMTFPLTPSNLIDRQFGQTFSSKIIKMEPGTWQGPVESSYGFHLVLVEEIKPAYDPPLSDIRAAVERDLMSERRRDLLEKMYDRLREKYSVIIESKPESE